jgi:hypothetical protein
VPQLIGKAVKRGYEIAVSVPLETLSNRITESRPRTLDAGILSYEIINPLRRRGT